MGDHPRPRLAISACLLGQPVRYDGGHKRDAWIVEKLGKHVDWVPLCPEIDIGLGAPRPTLRVVQIRDTPHLVSTTGADLTRRMDAYSREKIPSLGEIDGYLLKKGSPSCGIERVKVYGENGMPLKPGRGVFALAVFASDAAVTVEDEGRLCDDLLRDSFLSRVFAHARLRALIAGDWRGRKLIEFHARHKLLVLAHSPAGYRELGRLVAGHTTSRVSPEKYRTGLMEALAKPATRGRHVNVLQHMAGYVTDDLDAAARRELQDTIEEYRQGILPLAAPRTLLRHHIRRLKIAYLLEQTYLEPYPKTLSVTGKS
jgi:uncharacterized protein YbgA (DUF1722 family)/uncharacterized protein YbbK (DUF523 family)